MRITKITIALIVGLTLSAACTYNQVIKHPSNMNITSGSDVGPYTSKGVIRYQDSTLSFATFLSGEGGVNYFGVWSGVNNELDEDETSELQAFIDEHLVKKAREMGGNTIINVQYRYENDPIFIPGLLGLGIKTMSVEGEVVKTK